MRFEYRQPNAPHESGPDGWSAAVAQRRLGRYVFTTDGHRIHFDYIAQRDLRRILEDMPPSAGA